MHNNIPQWLVPNLIGAGGGLYLCSAKAKTGKTLVFGYQLAYAIAISGEFLGLPCSKGKVLFFETEEPLPTIVKRLRTKGFNPRVSGVNQAIRENRLVVERDFKIDSDLSYLRDRVREIQPSLVIYDSLRKITAHLGVSENEAGFASHLYTLQAVHNLLGVPGLVIHHNNKTGEGLNGVSGSGGIPGATDGVILLKPNTEYSGHAIDLETVPREGFAVNYTLQRKKDHLGFWSYQTVSVQGVNPEVLKWERKLIRALVMRPTQRLTRKELETLLDCQYSHPLDAALERLSDSYQIAEDFNENGIPVYWMPGNSPWVLSGIENTSLGFEIESAQKLIACTTSAEVMSLSEEWNVRDPSHKQKVWDLLTEDEKLQVRKLLNPPTFEIGEWVRVIASGQPEKISKLTWDKDDFWQYHVEGSSTLYKERDIEMHPDYHYTSEEINF